MFLNTDFLEDDEIKLVLEKTVEGNEENYVYFPLYSRGLQPAYFLNTLEK